MMLVARDSVADVSKRFGVHEAPKTIPSGETIRFPASMGVDSRRELGRDPDVDDPVQRKARDNVNVVRRAFDHHRPIGSRADVLLGGVLRFAQDDSNRVPKMTAVDQRPA